MRKRRERIIISVFGENNKYAETHQHTEIVERRLRTSWRVVGEIINGLLQKNVASKCAALPENE